MTPIPSYIDKRIITNNLTNVKFHFHKMFKLTRILIQSFKNRELDPYVHHGYVRLVSGLTWWF